MTTKETTTVRFRVDPEFPRSTRPRDTYDVIDGDSYDHIVGNLTRAEATFIAAVLNGEVTADDLCTWWEYAIMHPASMPDMSGKARWTQIVGATFRSRDQAERARRQVPSLRGVPTTICRRRVSAWEEARDE